ncbi:MAG: DUF6430 domain-containing protein [Firmicutes bacterium]|nr:DUF6430 domain-containing protein [Bacillota bacterium]
MNKFERLIEQYGVHLSIGFCMTAFTILPESLFNLWHILNRMPMGINILLNRLIFCAVVFAACGIGCKIYYSKRKSVMVEGANFQIKIEYGDLLSISDGKKVINFDECFSTDVGEEPYEIKPNSICGQYIKTYGRPDIGCLIKKYGLKSERDASEYQGKVRYESGRILPKDDFLLMAFAKLDKDGLGHLTYDEYLKCLDILWDEIDKYHGNSNDVYIPVLGSNITRFDKELTQQQLLDIMIASYRLSPKKLRSPCTLHIVCRPRREFSLNNIFGIC